jgi:hypothetical protein
MLYKRENLEKISVNDMRLFISNFLNILYLRKELNIEFIHTQESYPGIFFVQSNWTRQSKEKQNWIMSFYPHTIIRSLYFYW